jgi:ATP-dependent exoDNAse (exonuclease V) beta subunit
MSAPHTIIRASAGAGKTYRLSTHYLTLLFTGADPSSILASTFTRKAAGEILHRIFVRLGAACKSDEAAAELAAGLELDTLTLARARATLSTLVRSIDRVQVSTLDAFFARMASAFALDVGLPPRWRMMDEPAVQSLRLEAIRRMADANRDEMLQLWRLLNQGADERSLSRQLDALADHAHRLYVESDETAWLFLDGEIEGDPPSQAEVEALLAELSALPQPPHKKWIAAIDKDYAALQRRDYASPLGAGLGKAVRKKEGKYYGKDIDEPFLGVYERVVDVASRGVLHRFAGHNRSVYRLLQNFDAHFQQLKRDRGTLYFDDIQRLLGNLKQLGDLEEIFFRLESRIQHILLDEFQDTSREQWRVLSPIVKELASQVDPERSVFAVGDAKQAIYGWRGGEAEIFRSLHRELGLPKENVQELIESWRSSQPVLTAVNRVFESLTDNPVLRDFPESVGRWTDDFRPHRAHHVDQPGQAVYHASALPEFDNAASRQAAVRACAVDLLEELTAQHPGVQIGVLLKKNESLAQLRAALAERRIDASEEGGVSLARQPGVALLLSILRVAEHPGDRIALFHLASSPLREALELDLPPKKDQGARLSGQIRRQLHREGLRGTLLHYSLLLHPHCGGRSRARLRMLVAAAQRFEQDESQVVADFLQWIEKGREGDPTAAPIRLMTVHAAKGLEFPIVVLCDLEASYAKMTKDAFLSWRSNPCGAPDRITSSPKALLQELSPSLAAIARQSNELKISEQLSVLYVAMTRASHALHIVCAPEQKKRVNDSPAALLRAAFFPDGEPEPQTRSLLEGEERIEIELEAAEEVVARPMRAPRLDKSAAASRVSQEAPSAHGEQRIQSAPSLLRIPDPAARLRGIALHRCFEAIRFSEDELEADASILLGLRRELPDCAEEQLQEYLAEFHAQRANAVVSEALSQKSYAEAWGEAVQLEVWRERAFALRDGPSIVRGRFDRVVLGCDENGYARAHVLDFKSDRVDPDNPAELEETREYYTPQLEAYRRAVAHRCRLSEDVIECSLLFVSVGLHMRL